MLAAVTGEGPPLAASVPRARDVACLLGVGGQSHTTKSFSKKSPMPAGPKFRSNTPRVPASSAFSVAQLSSQHLLERNAVPATPVWSPISAPLPAPPRPSWSAQQEAGRAVGGSVCLLSVPGMRAPGGRGRTRRLRRAGTWRIRVWGPLPVRRERWFVLLSNRRT